MEFRYAILYEYLSPSYVEESYNSKIYAEIHVITQSIKQTNSLKLYNEFE